MVFVLQVRLWDARAGIRVTTYHGHQDQVNAVSFHWNSNWLMSGGRDATCRLFELRMNRELQRFQGHKKEVNTIAWHPIQETLFATGVLPVRNALCFGSMVGLPNV
jgi:polyadenylation factor subunit 2